MDSAEPSGIPRKKSAVSKSKPLISPLGTDVFALSSNMAHRATTLAVGWPERLAMTKNTGSLAVPANQRNQSIMALHLLVSRSPQRKKRDTSSFRNPTAYRTFAPLSTLPEGCIDLKKNIFKVFSFFNYQNNNILRAILFKSRDFLLFVSREFLTFPKRLFLRNIIL